MSVACTSINWMNNYVLIFLDIILLEIPYQYFAIFFFLWSPTTVIVTDLFACFSFPADELFYGPHGWRFSWHTFTPNTSKPCKNKCYPHGILLSWHTSYNQSCAQTSLIYKLYNTVLVIWNGQQNICHGGMNNTSVQNSLQNALAHMKDQFLEELPPYMKTID